MKIYRADIHVHTVLSPCGDLAMSPKNIVSEAAKKGLDIIGITDHNSTRHCRLINKLAEECGIFVLMGAEVTTKEEVHCLVFFESIDTLNIFQDFLDQNLPEILNNPDYFGDQVQVDEKENIIYTEKKLLTNAINVSLQDLEVFVHSNNGLFIPAHIDRMKNSIFSQLGFLPPDLKADALEISKRSTPESFSALHPEINKFPLLTNSDSHQQENIGMVYNKLQLEYPSFLEIKMSLNGENGRKIIR